MTALLNRGQTHDYSKLPNVLWACCEQSVPNLELNKKLGVIRDQIQHFVAPDDSKLRSVSLRFNYECIDPLLQKNFDINTVECPEDDTPDHLIRALMQNEILFHPPNDLQISEFDVNDQLRNNSQQYIANLKANFAIKGLEHILAQDI